VRVADDKARVLLVDGEARWEFRYLRNALARDPRVAVDAIVFHQPGSAGSTDLSYDTAWPAPGDPPQPHPPGRHHATPPPPPLPPPGPARAPPAAPAPLGRYDAILVGDVDPADLPPEAWARLD